MALKRYLLFAGETYYPSGGWMDFIRSFDSKKDAVILARQLKSEGDIDWFHIIDTQKPIDISDCYHY